jgi:ABC-type enterochelin transport system ATPase subunit
MHLLVKQIFELAERPSALLTHIDRAPEVGFSAWKEKNELLMRSLRELRGQERVLLQSINKKAELKTELREVSRKTLAYQQSNISAQFKVYQENQQAQKVVNDFVDVLRAPIQTLDKALQVENPYAQTRLGDIALQTPDPSSVRLEAATLANQLDANYQTLRQIVAEMQQRVERFQKDSSVINYLQETETAIATYRAEVTKLKDQGISTAQEAEIAIKRKQELEDAFALIVSQEEELKALQKQLLVAYARLKFHRRSLTKLRRKFVNDVLVSNSNLRITIDEQADIEQSNVDFRSILRLQEGTFIQDVFEIDEATGHKAGLLGRLVADGLLDPTHKRVTNLKVGILERSREILGQSVPGRLVTAIGRLSADDCDTLLEWFPSDMVRVEFRRSQHENFQSLERASAGQKTSSVLSFLLSHGEEPLLLDQPEDDLDNALVSELVVNQIRNNKSRRQIIVVTHNPNVVVNGDAELVLPMVFSAGQIHQNDAGGLQERTVREQICNIMEGGRDAFRQRYKRILKDLDAPA